MPKTIVLLQFDEFDKDYKLQIENITIRKNELNSQGEYLLSLENGDYEIKVESENGRLFELYQIKCEFF